MRSHKIQNLIDAVEAIYGPVSLYGSNPSEEHGTCFKIKDIPATFSLHTQEGTLPSGQYDIQIEGIPPGEYIYTSVMSFDGFLNLIIRMQGSENQWP